MKYFLDRVEDKKTFLNRAYLAACDAVVHDNYASVKFVQYLVENGADVTCLETDTGSSRTGLHRACQMRDYPSWGFNELLVKYLLLQNPQLYDMIINDGMIQHIHSHLPTHSLIHLQVKNLLIC